MATEISLPNLIPEDEDQLRFHNKGYLGGDGSATERVRRNFLACAFWSAAVRSDQGGLATVRFPAPDSLTRYRIVVVAHADRHQFGVGQAAFEVSKPLVLSPALPRFANVTDTLLARAVVQNQTSQSGEVLVSLELDDKARSPGAETNLLARRIAITPQGAATCEFPVQFTAAGRASWVWKARFVESETNSFTDAMATAMEIGYVTPRLRQVIVDHAENGANLLQKADPALLDGTGQITVQVANTRLLEVAESVNKLLHYPYGCVEQTSSSLLPWLATANSPIILPPPAHDSGSASPATDRAIRSGISRLFSMQTDSGGLAYWPGQSEPMPWASAYGALVLAIARKQNAPVPEPDFQRLVSYLSQQLRETNRVALDADFSCLTLYALAMAGCPEPGYHEKCFNLRASLSAENRALLALAVQESGGPEAMASDLLTSGNAASTPFQEFGGPARERAIQLLAWVRFQPRGSKIGTLVSDLLQERIEGQWSTTQGNAWALLALTEYARQVEGQPAPAQGELRYGGVPVSFHLDDTHRVFVHSFTLSNSTDGARLSLASNNQTLFTTVTVESRPAVPPPRRAGRGFTIHREYQELSDQDEFLAAGELHVGDRVLVSLQINVSDKAHYVVVDDPLPAVLEIVNPNFKTQQVSAGARQALASQRDFDYWPGDFQEARPDRMLFFANAVEPGTYQLRYLARVRVAGQVTAPPAKVEEMYHPDRFALGEPGTIKAAGSVAR